MAQTPPASARGASPGPGQEDPTCCAAAEPGLQLLGPVLTGPVLHSKSSP